MDRTLLFVGGYTHDDRPGVSLFDASDPTGDIELLGTAGGVEHPSFLALHPTLPVLYAVSETDTFEGSPGGGLVAYCVDAAAGTLAEIARTPSLGVAPCHVTVKADGSVLYVANYMGGSMTAISLAADGSFGDRLAHHRHLGHGPSPRQEAPHAHCVRPGPDGRSVYVADLGTDEVIRYEHTTVDDLERSSSFGFAPGAGPRQIAFHPTRPLAITLCELDSTAVLSAVDGSTGELTLIETHSTLPCDASGESIAADVQFTPDGTHVYCSNRGDDSIAAFAVGAGDRLEPLGHVSSGGRTPRSILVHPTGRSLLVANQESDNIVVFDLTGDRGLPQRLLESRHSPAAPTCLLTLVVPS